ncbi:MAG: nickel-dependent lactate racemase [Myxococcota bacterium]
MRIELDYGRGKLPVEIPDAGRTEVIRLAPEPALDGPREAVARALEDPIGTPPLADIAAGRRNACVVISDRTRPIPYGDLLPPLLAVLESAGIPKKNVLILVATGLHRAATAEELQAMLGVEIVRAYPIVSHDGRDPEAHARLGRSARGTPIAIDRRYVDADLKILTGLIEPHLMAGYSGGRKAICPGLAAIEMMQIEHGPRMLGGNIGNGILAGNPFHEDILDIARRAGADFILNCTVNREKQLTGVFAGDLEAAFMAGVRKVAADTVRSIDAPVDVAVTSGGGFPLDATFYQSIKGMIGCLNILRAGGTIILAARVSEGIGSPDFQRLLREAGNPERFMGRLFEPGFFVPDQWMVQHLCQVLRKAKAIVVSEGLPPGAPGPGWIGRARTVEEALRQAIDDRGEEATVAILPEGPYVLPTVRGETRSLAGA